jgi:hypothetical protein
MNFSRSASLLPTTAALQRLVSALNLLSAEFEAEGASLDFSGLHILICGKTALDSLGTLCLQSDDSAEDWADFLGGVDVEYARDKRDAAAALRRLEGAVAASLGVRMLFTAAHYIMTHEYRCAGQGCWLGSSSVLLVSMMHRTESRRSFCIECAIITKGIWHCRRYLMLSYRCCHYLALPAGRSLSG